MIAQPKRLHATVHGKVQGVSFRYFTLQAAKSLDLSGWVRNRFNSTVEVLAEGSHANLKVLLERIREGPSMANVSHVETSWEPASGEFHKFRVRMTR